MWRRLFESYEGGTRAVARLRSIYTQSATSLPAAPTRPELHRLMLWISMNYLLVSDMSVSISSFTFTMAIGCLLATSLKVLIAPNRNVGLGLTQSHDQHKQRYNKRPYNINTPPIIDIHEWHDNDAHDLWRVSEWCVRDAHDCAPPLTIWHYVKHMDPLSLICSFSYL